MRLRILLLSILAWLNLPVRSQNVVNMADMGLQPGTGENAVPYVIRALEVCRETSADVLYFPQGRYDFWPHELLERDYYLSNTTDNNPKRLAVLIEGMRTLTLDGGGSLFIMHDRIQPLTIDSSTDITLKDLTIDWDVPLTAQGVMADAGPDWFEVVVDPVSYPFEVVDGVLYFTGEGWRSRAGRIMEFDHVTNMVCNGDRAVIPNVRDCTVELRGRDRLRYHNVNGFERVPAGGNNLVIRHSTRDHAGIFVVGSSNIKLTDVTIHHTAGLGVLCQYSENISFDRVRVVPDKAKGRVFSGHDDGFHIMGCRGQIDISSCQWEGLMDDPVNIHGTFARIDEVLSDNTLKCRMVHHESQGLRWAIAGDIIGIVDNDNMNTVVRSSVLSFTPLDKEQFILELGSELEGVTAGMAVENLTWVPDVNITGSKFLSSRARGLLISTPGKVVIENNYFNSSGSAILIAGDANYWYESGAVTDVLIRDNIFSYGCLSSMYQFTEAVISILPQVPHPDRNVPYHRNIRIENNSFSLFDYPVLYAFSVDGLTFEGNRLERSYELAPLHPRKTGITLKSCRNVSISGNTVAGDVLGKNIVVEDMDLHQLKLGKDPGFRLTE